MAERSVAPRAESPWRAVVETVREHVSHKRDGHGSIGSINWLRNEMATRGANPNVVRNIIYRDKGKLHDKQVLYRILEDLMLTHGPGPLDAPALRALVQENGGYEAEILRLLGREKRRIFRAFVQSVQAGEHPKLLLTGRSGSGKSLMGDFIQQALEQSPARVVRQVRVEFAGEDLATALVRFASALELPQDEISARLVKLESASAFAVQADAQAAIARGIVDAARRFRGSMVLILHVTAAMAKCENMGSTQLRLSDAQVTRVNAGEWLWVQVFEPLSQLPNVSMVVSYTELPTRASRQLGSFQTPYRLTPPTQQEARRFVRARLGHLPTAQQEKLVRLAGRSYEELRTLTLLAEIRELGAEARPSPDRSVLQLAKAVDSSEAGLGAYLEAVATLSLPDHPEFRESELKRLLEATTQGAGDLAQAFVDTVSVFDGSDRLLRCFSRDLGGELRRRLLQNNPRQYRSLHAKASTFLTEEALRQPASDVAHRYLSFLFEAQDWLAIGEWMRHHPVPQSLVTRVWRSAQRELRDPTQLELLAKRVAEHYVKIGNYAHPDVQRALELLSQSRDPMLRTWTTLRRAEALSQRGQHDQAAATLDSLPAPTNPILKAEVAIARASIERWRGHSEAVNRLVFDEAAHALDQLGDADESAVIRVKHALWSGIIAKDSRDFGRALTVLENVTPVDDLFAARLAFQRGDVFMRIGLYRRALVALNDAVTLSLRADASPFERSRYRARRATVLRRLGQEQESYTEFEHALRDLNSDKPSATANIGDHLEHQLWRTKIDDEMVILMLATSRFDDALMTLEKNRRVFEAYASHHGVDLSYRLQRNRMRLALAYGSRGTGQPFRRPFPLGAPLESAHPDLEQARQILDGLIEETAGPAGDHALVSPLGRDVMQAGSMFSATGARAYSLAQRVIDTASNAYDLARAHAHAAAGALRMGDTNLADRHIDDADRGCRAMTDGMDGPEQGSGELRAWIMGLQLDSAIQRGDLERAQALLLAGLDDVNLSVDHRGLITVFAEAVTRHRVTGWDRSPLLRDRFELDRKPINADLRLMDALLAQWARVRKCDVALPAAAPLEAVA